MLEDPGLPRRTRQCTRQARETVAVLPSVQPHTPWLVRALARICGQGAVFLLEAPEEESIVGMTGTVYWQSSRPIPSQVPGDVGELLRHLEV